MISFIEEMPNSKGNQTDVVRIEMQDTSLPVTQGFGKIAEPGIIDKPTHLGYLMRLAPGRLSARSAVGCA